MPVKLTYIFLLTCLSNILLAQEPITNEEISSGGDYFSGSYMSLSWTLGTSCIETLNTENFILTQGFNQGSYLITSIETHPITDGVKNTPDIDIFPNPATNHVNIRFENCPENLDQNHWNVSIIDMSGKTILHKELETNHAETNQINISALKNAYYIIHIYTTTGNQEEDKIIQKTFKLVKQ